MIDIEILETHKDNTSFYPNRTGWTIFTKKDRFDLFPEERCKNLGICLRCKDGWVVSRTNSVDGEYAKVGNCVFIQEEILNFYV